MRMRTEFAAEDPLEERALEQMIVGASTRKHARSLEPAAVAALRRTTQRLDAQVDHEVAVASIDRPTEQPSRSSTTVGTSPNRLAFTRS